MCGDATISYMVLVAPFIALRVEHAHTPSSVSSVTWAGPVCHLILRELPPAGSVKFLLIFHSFVCSVFFFFLFLFLCSFCKKINTRTFFNS